MLSHNELVKLFPLKYLQETDGNGQLQYIFNPKEDIFKDTLQRVLKEVFKDFNFRTLTKNTEAREDKRFYTEKALQKALKYDNKEGKMTVFLVNKLEKYKDDNGESFFAKVTNYLMKGISATGFPEFDAFHNDLCETFLEAIKFFDEERTIELYQEIHYGKAQKIVNMMFKHLYCLEGAEEHEELFADCHMALDSFTLEWFERQNSEYFKDGNYHKQIQYKNGFEPKKKLEWSNLEYSENDEIHGHYSYIYYVRKIREMCISPFKEEFIIWPRIQQELSAEAFILAMPDEEAEEEIKTAYGKDTPSDQTIAKARKIRLMSMDAEKKIGKILMLSLQYIKNYGSEDLQNAAQARISEYLSPKQE